MTLLYIDKIPAAIRAKFALRVQHIAAFLNIHPDWLMQVMYAESRLKPTAANRQGKDKHLVAAGLLQFTAGSGIVKAGKVPSIAHILTMPALAQLDLVQWYFPAMIGKPDNWVLQTKNLSAATVARQNKGIAKGKSFITVADFKKYTVDLVPASLRDRVFGTVRELVNTITDEAKQVTETITAHPKESAGIGTGIIIGLCLLGWYIIKKG
jgi:hypothetical protein